MRKALCCDYSTKHCGTTVRQNHHVTLHKMFLLLSIQGRRGDLDWDPGESDDHGTALSYRLREVCSAVEGSVKYKFCCLRLTVKPSFTGPSSVTPFTMLPIPSATSIPVSEYRLSPGFDFGFLEHGRSYKLVDCSCSSPALSRFHASSLSTNALQAESTLAQRKPDYCWIGGARGEQFDFISDNATYQSKVTLLLRMLA